MSTMRDVVDRVTALQTYVPVGHGMIVCCEGTGEYVERKAVLAAINTEANAASEVAPKPQEKLTDPVPGCSNCPRLNVDDIADDYSELHRKLLAGELPLPCWIEIGAAAHLVTAQNHRNLAQGMLLSLEARGYFRK